MSLSLMFLLVLIICFAVVILLTRSTETERAVRRRMAVLSQEAVKKPTVEGTILKQEFLSPTPWVDDLLASLPGTSAMLNLVKQAGAEWWVSSVILASLGCAVIGGIIAQLRFDSAAFSVIAAVAAGFLPTAYLFILRYRKLQACETLLPQAIELMARALRAGHALNSAIEMVSHDIPEPLASEFRMVYEEQSLGLPLRDALMNLLGRIPRDDMRFLTTALLLQKETGGNLVQILETTARVMKERIRVRGQIRVHTAQARVTAWVVAVMPFVVFVLMNLSSPGYERMMLDDASGRTAVYVGLFMWITGVLMIRKLIAIKI